MSENRVVANNIFYLTLAEVLGRIFQFFYYKHITVALGTDAFGAFSWSASNVTYFFIIVGAGLDIYGIKAITNDRSKLKYYSDIILSLRLLLSLLAFVILCSYALYIPKSFEIKILLVISGIRLFGDAMLPNWVYQAVEKMQIIAIRNFAYNLINFVLAYWLISNSGDVYYSAGIISFNIIITSIISLYYFYFKIEKINFIYDLKKYIEILKDSVPIGLSIQIIIFYNFADIVMLGFLRENFEYEVGIYSASMRIILLASLPNQILHQAFFPKFSTDDPQSKDSFINRFVKMVYFIGSFLTIFIVLYANEIIQLQFSIDFYASIALLQFLVLKLFLTHISVSFSSPMLAKNHERTIMLTVGIALILNVILNYIFIPKYGFYGAAYTTIFCEFIIAAVFIYYNYSKTKITYFTHLLLSLFSLVIIYCVYIFTNNYLDFNIYISAIFSIFTFLILTILLKIVSFNELKALVKR